LREHVVQYRNIKPAAQKWKDGEKALVSSQAGLRTDRGSRQAKASLASLSLRLVPLGSLHTPPVDTAEPFFKRKVETEAVMGK
jgi:hypothetical protein